MSVVMSLYKPIKGVTPKFGQYWFMDKKEREKIDKTYEGDENSPYEHMYKNTFSDDKDHMIFEVNICTGPTRNKRIKSYEKQMKEIFKDYVIPSVRLSRSETKSIIIVDRLAYNQSWFFKDSFFKKTETTFIACTKENMLKLMDRYMEAWHTVYTTSEDYDKASWDFYLPSEVYYHKRIYYDIKKVKRHFAEAWDKSGEENLIFEIAF